jgi:hypothetical protein
MSPKVGANALVFGLVHGPFGHVRRVCGLSSLSNSERGEGSQQQELIQLFPLTGNHLEPDLPTLKLSQS